MELVQKKQSKLDIKNIKCRFVFENDIIEDNKVGRSYIYNVENVKVTIYLHSRSIANVTGLKCIEDVEYYKSLLERTYGRKCTKTYIDCLLLSKKDYRKIDMHSLYKYIINHCKDMYRVEYNIEIFPAMYLYPRKRCFPTVLIFRTGSYQFIGGNKGDCILQSISFVERTLHKFCDENILSLFYDKKYK